MNEPTPPPAGEEQPLVIAPEMLAPEPERERRIDFERGMRRGPPLALALIAANVLVFIWQTLAGTLESEESIIAAGALMRDRVLSGESWRLLTSTFLHGGIDHLVGNMLVLYILGMACEHAYGRARTIAIYTAGGLGGGLLSIAAAPGPSVGASGAIFGLLGAVIFFLYRYQNHFFLRDKRIGGVLLFWGLYQLATGFLTPFVDNFGHIGGAIGGLLAALAMRPALLPRKVDGSG